MLEWAGVIVLDTASCGILNLLTFVVERRLFGLDSYIYFFSLFFVLDVV